MKVFPTSAACGIAVALGGVAALDGAAAILTERGSVHVLNPLIVDGIPAYGAPIVVVWMLSTLIMTSGAVLALCAFAGVRANVLRKLGITAAVTLSLLALLDGAGALLRSGSLLQMSFVLAIAALLSVAGFPRPHASVRPSRMRHVVRVLVTAPIALILGLFLLMLTEGRIDARRPADAAVVLGARAYADGRPSDALADRLRTACALQLDGTVPLLIMSGGPGDGAMHETEAMRRFAVAEGVPNTAILLDPQGVNTDGTVQGTLALLHERDREGHEPVLLVVSHAYHLPRVRLAFRRAGLRVHPVPAHESYLLTRMPYFMLRESAALIVTYLRGLQEIPVLRLTSHREEDARSTAAKPRADSR